MAETDENVTLEDDVETEEQKTMLSSMYRSRSSYNSCAGEQYECRVSDLMQAKSEAGLYKLNLHLCLSRRRRRVKKYWP